MPTLEGRRSKIWTDIINIALLNPDLHNFYIHNSHITLGDRSRVHFWLDKWIGNVCLKEEFPRLFSLSNNKHRVVRVFFENRDAADDWNPEFRRTLLAWKEEEVLRLVCLLRSAPDLCSEKPDALKWTAESSRVFSAASAYKWSESLLSLVTAITGSIWNNSAPPKVQFFGWLAWHGKVKTSYFLHRIGILDGSVNLECVLCHNDVETVEHILLVCPFVWRLWSNNVRWWGFQ